MTHRDAVSINCGQMHLTRGSGQIHEVVKCNSAADSARIFAADDVLPCQKLCCGRGKTGRQAARPVRQPSPRPRRSAGAALSTRLRDFQSASRPNLATSSRHGPAREPRPPSGCAHAVHTRSSSPRLWACRRRRRAGPGDPAGSGRVRPGLHQ